MESTKAIFDEVQAIASWLDAKKGNDIETIEVSQKTVLADWFIITSAQSITQVRALTDYVLEQMKKTYGKFPNRVEGQQTNLWVLLDYGDVVVHIFQRDERALYNLESLWRRLEA